MKEPSCRSACFARVFDDEQVSIIRIAFSLRAARWHDVEAFGLTVCELNGMAVITVHAYHLNPPIHYAMWQCISPLGAGDEPDTTGSADALPLGERAMVEAICAPRDGAAAAAPDSKALNGVIEGHGVFARGSSLLALNLQASVFHPVVQG